MTDSPRFLVLDGYSRTGRDDHALAHAETHLARRKIGNDDDLPADKAFRLIGGLDPGKYLPLRVAEIQRQRQQLVGARHRFRFLDARDTQVDLHEVVDADRVLVAGRRSVVGIL